MRTLAKWVGGLLLALLLLVLASFVNHTIRLNQESSLFAPLGEMVSVGDNSLSVYTAGEGVPTLVFMAGSGTASPILDFRSLYSTLVDEYAIAVVERLGYGFSDVAAEPRDTGTVLEETRAALTAVNAHGPFVLFPHSMAMLEAIQWARLYPDEVTAIVGLDVAVPSTYEAGSFPNRAMLELSWLGARAGVTRFFPAVADDSAAISAGSLTDDEKAIYRAIFYRRTLTRPMVAEVQSVLRNAEEAGELPAPSVPVLLFTSNGEGTGFGAEAWHQHQAAWLATVDDAQQVILDSSHYVHNYDHEAIAARSKQFIEDLKAGGE